MRDKIIAGPGAFKNHVRILALLDDKYQGRMVRGDQQSYRDQAGWQWCSYSRLVTGNLDGVPPHIVEEMEQKMGVHDLTNLDSKMKFVREVWYPAHRTWHNWINTEHFYYEHLQRMIFTHHDVTDVNDRTLLLTMDPEQAYRRYVKFNSNLNFMDKETFKYSAEVLNQKFHQLARNMPNMHVLDAGRLWTGQLPRDWYLEMCGVFGLEDRYDHAQQVHALWYEAHLRAERDIVAHFTEIYSKDK